MNKKYDKLIVIFFFSSFIVIILFFGYKSYDNGTKYIKSEYKGVIQNLRFVDGGKKTPEILIDSIWIYMSVYGGSAKENMVVGDSISKIPNTDSLLLYKKENNQWQLFKVYKYYTK